MLGQRVVIHHYAPGVVDAEGNVQESYSPPIGASGPTAPAFVQPSSRASGETPDGGQMVAANKWKMYLSASEPISTSDRVTWHGRVFDVSAIVDQWAPNRNHHRKVELSESGWVHAD